MKKVALVLILVLAIAGVGAAWRVSFGVSVLCGSRYRQCGNTIITLNPNTFSTSVTVTFPAMLGKPHISFSTREALGAFATTYTVSFVPIVNPSASFTVANFPVAVTDLFPNNYAAIDSVTNPFPLDDFRVEANVVTASSSANAFICFQTSPDDVTWHDYAPVSGGCADVGTTACLASGLAPPCLSVGSTFPAIDTSCFSGTYCFVRLVAEGGGGAGDNVVLGSVFLEERNTASDPVTIQVLDGSTTPSQFVMALHIAVQTASTLSLHVDWSATV